MKKSKKRDPFAMADVVITDNDDPLALITEPGTYALADTVRGVYQTIEVAADGSRRVLKTVPLGAVGRHSPAVSALAHPSFELQCYRVGTPLHPDRTQWPEGTQVEISPSGLTFFQFIGSPTDREAVWIEQGRIAMRLISTEHTLIVLVRCGDSPWEMPCTAFIACRRSIASARLIRARGTAGLR